MKRQPLSFISLVSSGEINRHGRCGRCYRMRRETIVSSPTVGTAAIAKAYRKHFRDEHAHEVNAAMLAVILGGEIPEPTPQQVAEVESARRAMASFTEPRRR